MDDYLASCPSKTGTFQVQQRINFSNAEGGYKLTKFVGSYQSSSRLNHRSTQRESLHILGVKGNHKRDTLVVSRVIRDPVKEPFTQRIIVSCVATVFAP